ncbi:hypothetical protein OS493_006082 [Desmophyllum pertusum]|uniref:Uncharacterized protein n=1 Tax=Desmophyllum pertusum TaxID=174260 RepID=A0A9W9YHG0_9CNID|nr:hypothetical protein OS493_006082 [Desmophyllum pertusum]
MACYRSTRHHDKRCDLKRKECATRFDQFLQSSLLASRYKSLPSISASCIKVDMVKSPPFGEDIQNAQDGMRILISAGIELKAMTEENWGQLAEYASIELPEYRDSERQKLDQHIAKISGGHDKTENYPT